MDVKEIKLPQELVVESVTGLTNTAIDSEHIVPDRAATEGQIAALSAALAVANEMIELAEAADDGTLASIWTRLEALEEQIEACCTVDHGAGALDTVWARLEVLEAQVSECLNSGHATTGDGTPVSVSFVWAGDGSDPVADGGQATAVSADANRTIAGYWFLSRDANTGLYYRASAVYGGDYTWRIDMTTGAVTAVEANGASVPYSSVIVAVDDMGNEGATGIELPIITSQQP